MNKSGIRELNKVFSKTNPKIDKLRTFYIDSDKNIVSKLNAWITSLDEQEMFKYLEVLKTCLTGKFGANLFNVSYSAKDSMGENNIQYKKLFNFSRDGINDDEKVVEFVDCVINSYENAGRYLIVLGHGVYDVPKKGTDKISLNESEDIYRFVIGAVCPVELVREGLCYNVDNQGFEIFMKDWAVKNPESGFLFPAFNDRQEDVYEALFYTKNPEVIHTEFVENVMGTHIGKTNVEYKTLYNELIEESLDIHCNYQNVNLIRYYLTENDEGAEHASDDYLIDKQTILNAMESAEIDEEYQNKFSELFDEKMREDELKEIPRYAVVDTEKVEIESDDFKLVIDEESSKLFNTRVIDGKEYLLIPVTNNIRMNGIALRQNVK